jgi:hypothetical protein
MPFGLCNAPATFQRLIDELFRSRLIIDILAYLDDIILHTKGEEEHLVSLATALRKIISAGLKIKTRKCQIFQKRILYLGYEISEAGLHTDPAKVEKVLQWPFPETGIDMLSFLGLCNYYRSLIESFAEIADPLYRVAQQPRIEPTDQLVFSFARLKKALASAPVLRVPDSSLPFILETDASQIAVGGVLKQKFGEIEHPVGYFSKGLSKTERNYSTYERELYAVVRSCEAFRVFLYGQRFALRTDHQALMGLFNTKLSFSTRIVRWVMRLQPYSFTVTYIAGKDNITADALSRIPWPMTEEKENEGRVLGCLFLQVHQEADDDEDDSGFESWDEGCEPLDPAELGSESWADTEEVLGRQLLLELSGMTPPPEGLNAEENPVLSETSIGFLKFRNEQNLGNFGGEESRGLQKFLKFDFSGQITLEVIREAQVEDPVLSRLRVWVRGHREPSRDEIAGESHMLRVYLSNYANLVEYGDVLAVRFEDQTEHILIPPSLVERLIALAHQGPGTAHEGIGKTLKRLKKHFYWFGMKKDVGLHVTLCSVCDAFQSYRQVPKAPLNPFRVGHRNELVALDVLGGQDTLQLTPLGNRVILVMMDLFTKFAVAAPMPDQRARTTVTTFNQKWVLLFGAPMRILTDNGRNFVSHTFRAFCDRWLIRKDNTTPYHPHGNGALERVNRTLTVNLQKLVQMRNIDRWDEALQAAVFAYNTTEHSATGFTPQYLTFAQEARIPSAIVIGPPEQENPASLASRQVHELARAFETAREVLGQTQRRMKDRYDNGAAERIFRPGDRVRVRLVNLNVKPGAKLKSKWSRQKEVVRVQGPVVYVRDPYTQLEHPYHMDRLVKSAIEEDPDRPDSDPDYDPEEVKILPGSGKTGQEDSVAAEKEISTEVEMGQSIDTPVENLELPQRDRSAPQKEQRDSVRRGTRYKRDRKDSMYEYDLCDI